MSSGGGIKGMVEFLKSRFPGEEAAIDEYFRLCKTAAQSIKVMSTTPPCDYHAATTRCRSREIHGARALFCCPGAAQPNISECTAFDALSAQSRDLGQAVAACSRLNMPHRKHVCLITWSDAFFDCWDSFRPTWQKRLCRALPLTPPPGSSLA
jgi:hypothetical protein